MAAPKNEAQTEAAPTLYSSQYSSHYAAQPAASHYAQPSALYATQSLEQQDEERLRMEDATTQCSSQAYDSSQASSLAGSTQSDLLNNTQEIAQYTTPHEDVARYVSKEALHYGATNARTQYGTLAPEILMPSKPPTSRKKPLSKERRRPMREISMIFGVTLGPIIGKGAFGAVYAGTWNGAKVAVKSITSQDFTDLYNEAFVLRSMRHPNIVQFYGLFDKDDKHYIVTEFVEGGSLDSLLSAKASYFTLHDLVRLARDAAWGMQLLEQKKVLHRDLAARNLLVDLARQQMTVRVADFGMSRVCETFVAPANSLSPIKWSAPEVLSDRVYTSKSDVWSMGIVIWEMLNHGAEPYAYMTNKEAKDWILSGNRLTLPPITPPRLRQLVNRCWATSPADRPTFVEPMS